MAGYLASLGLPLPALGAVLAGSAELLGGLALLTGVALRPLAVPLVATMLVAAATAHQGFDIQGGGAEYVLTLAAVAAGLALTGPGRFALPVPRVPGRARAPRPAP